MSINFAISQFIFITLFANIIFAKSSCPLKDFHPPTYFKNQNIHHTPQESYPGMSYLHAGLDIMGNKNEIFATSSGILSYYEAVQDDGYYFDALSLDHGNGWVSVYMHVDLKSMNENIQRKISEKLIIKTGERIGRFNDGHHLPSHLHYVLFNQEKHIIFNPLNCLRIKDRVKPRIDSMLVTEYEQGDMLSYQYNTGLFMMASRSGIMNKVFNGESEKILKNKEYLISVFASDHISGNTRAFNIHKLEYQFLFFRENEKVGSFKKKQLFDASIIPCGYDCTLNNLWEGEFIKIDETTFHLPMDASLYIETDKHQGYLYRLNYYQYQLNSGHFEGLDTLFNPCDYKHLNYNKLKIKVKAYDFNNNHDRKVFEYTFDPMSCLIK